MNLNRAINIFNRHGVTLVELVIVLSIVGILAVAMGFSLSGWQGAYKVESQVRELHSDLLSVQGRAMQVGRKHFLRCVGTAPKQILIYDDDGNGTIALPDGDGTAQYNGPGSYTRQDTILTQYSKVRWYTLSWNGGVLTMDKRGMLSSSLPGTPAPWTLRVISAIDADLNCVSVTSTKINVGKWGTSCDVK